MLLRKATSADGPAMAQAWYAMMLEGGYISPPAPEGWEAALADGFTAELEGGFSIWFVVEEAGEVVATAAAFLRRSFWAETFGMPAVGLLAGVYTHPAYRRRGYARALVSAAIDWCKDKGATTLRLRAAPGARSLYESLGFTPSDEMEAKL